MNNELVSIITPNYNSLSFIKETFLSVVNQSYKNWEWIIVDDCSTDGSYEYIKNLIRNYNNIFLYRLDKNSGSAVARNFALRKSNGKYISFLDSDDILDYGYLTSQVSFIENNGPIITAAYNRKTNKSITPFFPRNNITYYDLLKGNDLSCLTTMYDRHIIGDCFFPEDMLKNEDYIFWLSILEKGYIVKTNNNVLATYVLNKQSKNANKRKLIKVMYSIYHKKLHFNCFKSCFFVFRWAVYGFNKYRKVK